MCDTCGCGQTEPSGEITHYFGKAMVAVVKLAAKLSNGDKICIKGGTTDFEMTVGGMRNEAEKPVESAEPGELVAFKTPELARPGDKVWIVMSI
jgi:hypothetical protein